MHIDLNSPSRGFPHCPHNPFLTNSLCRRVDRLTGITSPLNLYDILSFFTFNSSIIAIPNKTF
jgi:hypothetical protein